MLWVMSEITARLSTALADRYNIEREIGAGGMATVYLAHDVKHDRKVAVKVLRPELAAALGPERFLREIKIAARLNHPHILPLHDSGEAHGFLYYVMPYAKGESLREKLVRDGELPIVETVRILREVVDALAKAHSEGVVHRDIKPDNVMLSDRHALVTDFGVAKAVSEATGRQELTTAGVALGTPSYMAPEQAAASEQIDHRADIYAVGAMAYEMLTGAPPFSGTTPQQILATHVTEPPEHVTKRRPSVPPPLAQLVMRCLEKRPADRWQSAEELLDRLDSLTPSGEVTPSDTAPVVAVGAENRLRRNRPARVVGLFAATSVAALSVVYVLMIQLGLPDWVLPAALGALAVTLPAFVLAGRSERRRATAMLTGMTPLETGGWTWRRALTSGAGAFGLLGIAAAAYMSMRTLGIGPVGTVVGRGVLAERDRVILADFVNRAGDSSLTITLTEAFRIDLDQSPTVTLVQPRELRDVLRRMVRDPDTPVDLPIALEIAEREGIKAVVAGEINAAGGGFLLSARLVTAAGDQAASVRETARDASEILGAVDRLSERLRERLGESLRSIRANARLFPYTTESLAAMRQYTLGKRAAAEGDPTRAVSLLREAVAIDTTFARAYVSLGSYLSGTGARRSEIVKAYTTAMRYADRLPDVERFEVMGRYYQDVTGELDKAMDAIESAMAIQADFGDVLITYATLQMAARDFERAEELFPQAMATPAARFLGPEMEFVSLLNAQTRLGRLDAAEETWRQMAERIPDHWQVPFWAARLAYLRGELDSAEVLLRAGRVAHGMDNRSLTIAWLNVKAIRGQIDDVEPDLQALSAGMRPEDYVWLTALDEMLSLKLYGTTARAFTSIDSALARFPLADMDVLDRPYLLLAQFFARANQVERAKELLAEYETQVPEELHPFNEVGRRRSSGWIALAEGRFDDAVTEFRRADVKWCLVCALPSLARAHTTWPAMPIPLSPRTRGTWPPRIRLGLATRTGSNCRGRTSALVNSTRPAEKVRRQSTRITNSSNCGEKPTRSYSRK